MPTLKRTFRNGGPAQEDRLWPAVVLGALILCSGCSGPLNNPYPREPASQSVLYESFAGRPKHLDPAVAYSSNEYGFIAQIYEPPLQYHYLKRPYTLVPLTATSMPDVVYFNADGQRLPDSVATDQIAFSEYVISIEGGIFYQPHPALATDKDGAYRYHALKADALSSIDTLSDFSETGTRELTAEDYVYQIKRLVHPRIHSPIAELMKHHIAGLETFAKGLDGRKASSQESFLALKNARLEGAEVLDRYRYKVRILGKYPQFKYWLAMPFFAPMPWEADVFYAQDGLPEKNITLDWYPIGTGPYLLTENNPNRRMVMVRNPNYHTEFYPREGEPEDRLNGLLDDAGKQLPFIDKIVSTLEKESIPYWNKFLQGYYDFSGIASDNFDQAVQFSGRGEAELTPEMKEQGIRLQTAVMTSIFYVGFNMLDPVVGGYDESRRKLRQAISIALDYEEFISIFMNGRGIPAQGMVPPGIFGYADGEAGINRYVYDWESGRARRKNIDVAKRLLAEAGYPGGRDAKTGQPLLLYFDTSAAGPDDRSRLNWYRKQFEKLGIQLVIRATDYNRFQQKMRVGNAQIFMWGWNADYPDPENFFFLLYGPNGKVKNGGENAVNYENSAFDTLFRRMRNMDDGDERYGIIQELQAILRRDAPWVFGFHPKSFALYHEWYQNLKPNLMANNNLKYTKIDVERRSTARAAWNEPIYWPLVLGATLLIGAVVPAYSAYRKKSSAAAL